MFYHSLWKAVAPSRPRRRAAGDCRQRYSQTKARRLRLELLEDRQLLSGSNPVLITLSALPVATPWVYGERETFLVTVASGGGSTAVPSGTVDFKDGAIDLGVKTLRNGVASLSTRSLTVGIHNFTVAYSGDTNYDPATSSPPLAETVNPADTFTQLLAMPNPAPPGQAVVFTAFVGVKAPGSGTPTGSVTFTDTYTDPITSASVSTPLGTAKIDKWGWARLSTSSLVVGANSIVASYATDGNYNSSQSAAVIATVGQVASRTLVSSAPDPGNVGQPVTFTASVLGVGFRNVPVNVPPTGTVNFFVDGSTTPANPAPIVLTGTTATFTTSTLTAGAHTITAVYSGDANYLGSTSNPWIERIVVSTGSITGRGTIHRGAQAFSLDVLAALDTAGTGVTLSGLVSFTDTAKLGAFTGSTFTSSTFTSVVIGTGGHVATVSGTGTDALGALYNFTVLAMDWDLSAKFSLDNLAIQITGTGANSSFRYFNFGFVDKGGSIVISATSPKLAASPVNSALGAALAYDQALRAVVASWNGSDLANWGVPRNLRW